MAIVVRPDEKRLLERVEHVEGVRYELVLTSHAVYVERQVSIMSQWVGGILLAVLLHVIGTIVQYVLLRRAHESMRIPYRSLRCTGVRKVPRHIILLLGVASAVVIPLLLGLIGGIFEAMRFPVSIVVVFPILAVLSFFVACIVTVVLMIRFPRTALVLGGEWRDFEFHTLGNEDAVRAIAERVVAIQERVIGGSGRASSASSQPVITQPASAAAAPVATPAPAPLPGPQTRR
jgi:hypothetical protein